MCVRMSSGEMSAARTTILPSKAGLVNYPLASEWRKVPRTHPFSPLRIDLTTSLTPRFRCRDLEAVHESRGGAGTEWSAMGVPPRTHRGGWEHDRAAA